MSIFKGIKGQISVKVIAKVNSDYGKVINVPFTATYTRLTTAERKAIMQQIEAGEVEDTELLGTHLVSWSNLMGEGNIPVEYNEENLAAACEVPEYLQALVEGFFQAQLGIKSVRAKN